MIVRAIITIGISISTRDRHSKGETTTNCWDLVGRQARSKLRSSSGSSPSGSTQTWGAQPSSSSSRSVRRVRSSFSSRKPTRSCRAPRQSASMMSSSGTPSWRHPRERSRRRRCWSASGRRYTGRQIRNADRRRRSARKLPSMSGGWRASGITCASSSGGPLSKRGSRSASRRASHAKRSMSATNASSRLLISRLRPR